MLQNAVMGRELSCIALSVVVGIGCTFYTSCPDIPPPVSQAGSGNSAGTDSDSGTGEGGISDTASGGSID